MFTQTLNPDTLFIRFVEYFNPPRQGKTCDCAYFLSNSQDLKQDIEELEESGKVVLGWADMDRCYTNKRTGMITHPNNMKAQIKNPNWI